MRSAFVVAIKLTFAIGALAQTKVDRSPSGGCAQAASKERVEPQAQCEARQQQMRDPAPASAFRRVMRRGSATDSGRSDEPAVKGMHHGVERAKGIEPSYAAWEAAVLPLNYARQSIT